MDDISPDFNQSKPDSDRTKKKPHPQLVELVKLLARLSAEEYYNKHLRKQDGPKGEPQ